MLHIGTHSIGTCASLSHLKLHFALHASHSTLHTPHFTLHPSQSTLHTSQATLHTSHSTLHTSHFTLRTSYFTLHTSHCTLLAPHFTLHPSSHLSSSHLIPAHLLSSHLFSYVSKAFMNFILGSHHFKQLQARQTRDMLAFSLSCINTSLQCGANSASHNRKHPTTHAPILFWFAFPSFFTNFEFLMCPFFTIPFFAWHHTETVLFLHQTPLKLHVFTSEVSRTQNPARCRSWPFFISLWILGNDHADTTTRCRTQRRNQFAHETTPAAPAAHTRYLSSSAAATLYGKTQGFVLRLPPHKVAHATLTQPFQCDPQPEIQETHITTQTNTTTRCRTQRRNQFAHETTPAAPAAHTRYLSSSAAATLYGKTQGFVLRLPPHKIAHATLTQPFQCDPQPEIQETNRTTQTDTTTRCRTQRRNQFAHETTPAAPAAHTRYLASSPAATLHGKTQGFVLRLPPHKVAHATLTQPFQCDPQPEIQETHITTQTNTTTRCRTQRRNQFAHETTPAAPAAHTRYLSSPAAATLHRKTQGFVLRLPPQNRALATSCSHSNAIYKHRFQNTL